MLEAVTDCILNLLGAGDPEPRLSPDWSLLLTLPATILTMEGSANRIWTVRVVENCSSRAFRYMYRGLYFPAKLQNHWSAFDLFIFANCLVHGWHQIAYL